MTSALIIGRSISVWDEIAAAKELHHPYEFDSVICVGPIAQDYPGEVDAWVYFHTELFEHYHEKRLRKGYPPVRSFWGNRDRRSLRDSRPTLPIQHVTCRGGGSGLIAVTVALGPLQHDRVVLAGMPMTVEGGQYDNPKKVWTEAPHHRAPWEQRFAELDGKVKSMSGWTAQLLGVPTREWLNG